MDNLIKKMTVDVALATYRQIDVIYEAMFFEGLIEAKKLPEYKKLLDTFREKRQFFLNVKQNKSLDLHVAIELDKSIEECNLRTLFLEKFLPMLEQAVENKQSFNFTTATGKVVKINCA